MSSTQNVLVQSPGIKDGSEKDYSSFHRTAGNYLKVPLANGRGDERNVKHWLRDSIANSLLLIMSGVSDSIQLLRGVNFDSFKDTYSTREASLGNPRLMLTYRPS